MRRERHVPAEEMLEEVWTLKESGAPATLPRLRESSKIQPADATIEELLRSRRLRLEGETVHFDGEGEKEAREIVRRNRLTSALFSQIFELEASEVEEAACELEHVLNPRVTDSLCTLLGHPPSTPDGRPIPRGECCLSQRCELRPLVRPLTQVGVGQAATVVFIVPSALARLQRLTNIGLVPGGALRLLQKRPCYAVEVGQTTLALEEGVASEIYVREG
jgi:DtxR family Mn-dependent transcriptional regulator